MSEKLCLKWNDFQDNVNSAFGSLREDSDFTDVTLACGDGQQIEAHKVILAAQSPFFQGLFKRNKHPNQLVYMRGVIYENLVAIVDFLYHGEANVFQENLDSFLAIAEDLKLKGLMGENGPKDGDDMSSEVGQKTNATQPTESKHIKEEKYLTSERKINHKALAIPGSGDFAALEEQVRSMMEKSENRLPKRKDKKENAFASICKVCGKEGNGIDIKRHIEANHLKGISLPCNLCENTFRSRRQLVKHRLKQHVQ